MKYILLFEKFKVNTKSFYNDRFKSYKQKVGEVNKMPEVQKFIRNFDKVRNRIYKNFDGLEIKPVFIEPYFIFVSDSDIERGYYYTIFKELGAMSGDIYCNYNDEHVLFRSDKNNVFSFNNNKKTKYNVSSTKESREVINSFLSLIKSLKISFNTEQIPNIYRKDI